jgi:hypothetical protein
VGVLAWRSRGWPLIHDAPLMHYIAWRISEGAVPYRDLFDMNFPGVYLLHLAALKLFGAGDAGWRAFDLVWLAATSLAAAALAAPWGRLAAAGAGLFMAVYHLAAGAWQTGQRDFLLCPFLLLAALAVARWAERPGQGASLAWGGLALGVGITVKPHAGIAAAARSALAVVAPTRAARRRAADGSTPAARRPVGAHRRGSGGDLRGGDRRAVARRRRRLAAVGALPRGTRSSSAISYRSPRLGRPDRWTFYRWRVASVAAGVTLARTRLAAAA